MIIELKSGIVEFSRWLAKGDAAFHVLRLVGNGQISAAKGAELLVELQEERTTFDALPMFEGGAPQVP